jgi:hypothetical protein
MWWQLLGGRLPSNRIDPAILKIRLWLPWRPRELNDFLIQLPALIGVVVGAAASYLTASAQWSRSQRVRWEDKRVQVYADYGHAVKRVYELSKRLAASRGLPTLAAPLPLKNGRSDLMQASIERSEKWERLLLIGDPDTIAAARTWHRTVWRMEEFANGQLSDPDQWRDTVRVANESRSRFYEAARRDLGIVSGQLPEPDQEIL